MNLGGKKRKEKKKKQDIQPLKGVLVLGFQMNT